MAVDGVAVHRRVVPGRGGEKRRKFGREETTRSIACSDWLSGQCPKSGEYPPARLGDRDHPGGLR
jgi:hypothetical protein